MPELPEVETVKETLKNKLLNRKIHDVIIKYENTIEYPDTLEFQKRIKNQKIIDIKRRGKWLVFNLEDYFLLSHLRMEGKYFFKDKTQEILKHEHVIFNLDDEEQLRYHDTRKFGKMYLVTKEELTNTPLNELGLEPWDNNLTCNYLKEKYKNKSLAIKTVLLDQSIIVGIGNIYADEILFLSKINPYTKVKLLTDNNLEDIIRNTKKVLEEAIKKGGTTIRSYTSVDGVTGLFQNDLLVHGREGENCPICKNTILKTKINGRGTYYCPECEK